MNPRRPLLFSLLASAVWLAACLPVPAPQPALPGLAAANAEATLTVIAVQNIATQAASLGTRAALDADILNATLSAAQTRDAVQLTSQAVERTATAAAARLTATQQAIVGGTGTAVVEHANATATRETSLALGLTQAAQATTQAYTARQVRIEAGWQAFWGHVKNVIWGLVIVLAFIAAIKGWQKFIPRLANLLDAREIQMRTRKSKSGDDYIVARADDPLHILQPGRSTGHALLNRGDTVDVAASPAGPQWQDQATARQQLAEIFRHLNHIPASQRTPLQHKFLNQFAGLGHAPALASPTPPIEVLEGTLVEAEVQAIVDEIAPQLLENGETP